MVMAVFTEDSPIRNAAGMPAALSVDHVPSLALPRSGSAVGGGLAALSAGFPQLPLSL
jgi:hypothetical protein